MIHNASGPGEEVLLLCKSDLEIVISLLLSVFGSGCSRGNAGLGRSGPNLLQLTEGILVEFDGVGEARRNETEKYESNLHVLRWVNSAKLSPACIITSLKKITQTDR